MFWNVYQVKNKVRYKLSQDTHRCFWSICQTWQNGSSMCITVSYKNTLSPKIHHVYYYVHYMKRFMGLWNAYIRRERNIYIYILVAFVDTKGLLSKARAQRSLQLWLCMYTHTYKKYRRFSNDQGSWQGLPYTCNWAGRCRFYHLKPISSRLADGSKSVTCKPILIDCYQF